MDTVDAKTRSRIMASIRGKDTRPELRLRSLLHRSGLRFRLHAKDLPGKPDLVFPKYRAVIQVHGCFWHGHDCGRFKLPETHRAFWSGKISRNRERDAKSEEALLSADWRIGIIWECALVGTSARKDEALENAVRRWLFSRRKRLEIPRGK